MTELNGNEKYRYGVSLPTAAQYFATIEAGDLMLYGSNCLVLFYGAAGGYSYTRIGKLSSTDGLAKAVGNGATTVTFEKPTCMFFRLVANVDLAIGRCTAWYNRRLCFIIINWYLLFLADEVILSAFSFSPPIGNLK